MQTVPKEDQVSRKYCVAGRQCTGSSQSGSRGKPTNLTEVRSFTALAAYYRKFVKGFAAIAKPLFELTQKGRPFVWTSRQQNAFEQLKKCLTEASVLTAPLESGQY